MPSSSSSGLTCGRLYDLCLHTPDREDTYCCYQAMFCSGFKKADYDKFFCSYHDEDYILWRGAANRRFLPSQTPSCDALIDMAKL